MNIHTKRERKRGREIKNSHRSRSREDTSECANTSLANQELKKIRTGCRGFTGVFPYGIYLGPAPAMLAFGNLNLLNPIWCSPCPVIISPSSTEWCILGPVRKFFQKYLKTYRIFPRIRRPLKSKSHPQKLGVVLYYRYKNQTLNFTCSLSVG